MEQFMRRWVGVIILIFGIATVIMGVLLLGIQREIAVGVITIVIGFAFILTGVAVNGISSGMNQIGDVLTQIMKGLQSRQ